MIKYILIALGVLCILLSMSVMSHAYNRGQTELLNMAYNQAKDLDYPDILQVIMLNETQAGTWGRHGDKHFEDWKSHCYGVMQIQFHTAKMVVKNWTNYKFSNDKVLRRRLTYDDAFNVEIARKYVKWLLKSNNNDYFRTILSYNVGLGNVQKRGLKHDPNGYLKRAKRQIARLNKFNLRHGNGVRLSYTIQKGDTLFNIAKRFLGNGWAYKKIMESNPGIDPRRLKIGSKLYIVKS